MFNPPFSPPTKCRNGINKFYQDMFLHKEIGERFNIIKQNNQEKEMELKYKEKLDLINLKMNKIMKENNILKDINQKNIIKESKFREISKDNKKSELSTKGGKTPLSLYTRRVIDTSNISKFLTKESTHGLCGGKNLGNTCFMNSSIACISNCTELTYYFLSGDYIKDINKENKLGMGGKLAMSWGALLQQYWVEKTRVGNPAEFKKTLGDKVKMFRGFGQQDSNEFMNFFIDYLNEDLNTKKKRKKFQFLKIVSIKKMKIK